jgi:hypothetical protein
MLFDGNNAMRINQKESRQEEARAGEASRIFSFKFFENTEKA